MSNIEFKQYPSRNKQAEKEKASANTLSQEIINNKLTALTNPITVKTIEGEPINLPLHDIILAMGSMLGYNFKINRNNYPKHGLHTIFVGFLSKAAQTPYDNFNYIYITYQPKYTVIELQTPDAETIKKIQKYLQKEGFYDKADPIDGRLDESFISAINRYRDEHIYRASWNEGYYKTKQGYIRHIKAPSSTPKYSVGVTECPYQTIEEVFEHTEMPKSLTECDFFCNYINGLPARENEYRSEGIQYDETTGNQVYKNSGEKVNIEDDYHRNIQRFLIKPFYEQFSIPKDRARVNTIFDLYKYYLFLSHGNKEEAKKNTLQMMNDYIDPIVNSAFEQRIHDNYKLFSTQQVDENHFVSSYETFMHDKDRFHILNKILEYNAMHSDGGYTRQEIEKVFIDYFIHFRRYAPDIAKQKVLKIIEDKLSQIEQDKNYTQEELAQDPDNQTLMKELQQFEKMKFKEK